MPRKLRRVSAFFKILTVLVVVCGALVAGGYYVMTSIQPLDVAPPPPAEGCTLTTAKDTDRSGGTEGQQSDLEPDQAANAATVNGVAFESNLPKEAVVVAYAAVWQESKFRNVEHGDRDSMGLFQQRPSQRWGSPDQLTDPVYATGAFYDKLTQISGYRDMPVYEAAQTVQRSADGYAYDQHEDLARAMATAFGGTKGPAVSCWFKEDTDAKPDIAGARAELGRVFGVDPEDLPRARDPETGDLGWAMALWAMANAQDYDLTSVTYGDRRWTPGKGQDGWSKAPTPAPEGELVLR